MCTGLRFRGNPSEETRSVLCLRIGPDAEHLQSNVVGASALPGQFYEDVTIRSADSLKRRNRGLRNFADGSSGSTTAPLNTSKLFLQPHKGILCYIIYRRYLGKEKSDVQATFNCGHIRIQVCSSLFGVCRIQLGIAGEAFPLQDSAISIESHRCQTFDGEAFRPNG